MSSSSEQPAGQEAPKNTYIINPESGVELARLMRQDQLVTQGMGGIFPEQPDLEHVDRVLDLACGPGSWVLDVAFAYQAMQVVGVDISEGMVRYARARAHSQQRPNATFQIMNILDPFTFPDNSFDLVNARAIAALMPKAMWPKLFAECVRVLRPGGLFRLTEGELGPTNTPAFEQCQLLFCRAMNAIGYNFSPTGQHYGIIQMLPRFFKDAGLQEIGKMAHVIDFSFDTPFHESFYQNYTLMFHNFEALIRKTALISLEAWHDLSQKALAEMQEKDFCALWLPLTVWGRKPA